jgi:hypothetical protein
MLDVLLDLVLVASVRVHHVPTARTVVRAGLVILFVFVVFEIEFDIDNVLLFGGILFLVG